MLRNRGVPNSEEPSRGSLSCCDVRLATYGNFSPFVPDAHSIPQCNFLDANTIGFFIHVLYALIEGNIIGVYIHKF